MDVELCSNRIGHLKERNDASIRSATMQDTRGEDSVTWFSQRLSGESRSLSLLGEISDNEFPKHISTQGRVRGVGHSFYRPARTPEGQHARTG